MNRGRPGHIGRLAALYAEVWRKEGFSLYWWSGLFSSTADILVDIGLLFAVYRLTRSTAPTALLVSAEMLPYFLLGVISGAMVAGLPKFRIVGLVNGAKGVLVGILAYLWESHHLPFPVMTIGAFALHTMNCFFKPAYRSVAREISTDQDFNAVNGAIGVLQSTAALIAPLLAAGLSTHGGLSWFFLLGTVAYGVSGGCVWRLYVSGHHDAHFRGGSVRASVKAAPQRLREWGQYALRSPDMLFVIAVPMAVFLGVMGDWHVGLPFYVGLENAHEKAFYAWLLEESAAVMLLSDLMIPYLAGAPETRWDLTGVVALTSGIVVLALSQDSLVTVIAVALISVGFSILNQVRAYFLMAGPPATLVGVGFSLSASLLFGTSALSMGVFAALAAHLGVRPVFWLSAVLLSAVFVAGAIGYVRTVRGHEKPPQLPSI